MKSLRLYKKEKLCSEIAIGQLFSRGEGSRSAMAYPLRAVWRDNSRRSSDAPVAFVVSIPKKRLRHAVDRVLMRRRVREAYRLCRPDFPVGESRRIDVAFVYVADGLRPFSDVDRAVRRLMSKITALAD